MMMGEKVKGHIATDQRGRGAFHSANHLDLDNMTLTPQPIKKAHNAAKLVVVIGCLGRGSI